MADCESIAQVREHLRKCPSDQLQVFIADYSADERRGVQGLVKQAKKKMECLKREEARIEALMTFEKKAWETCQYVAGMDEVGRGPLAGPVVTAAVILPRGHRILGINDSKKLSASKREELYGQIMEEALAVGIGMNAPERIDQINILQATYEAMREAVGRLDPSPELLLNDAVMVPDLAVRQIPIIHGDAKSISIGAASIVAKVTRDRMMVDYETRYPGYGFAQNKGYGTADHIRALREMGPTPIHRRSFIGHFISLETTESMGSADFYEIH